METYLVGGAVRDSLLDYPIAERDWVVVGAKAEELLSQGFQQVGKDFPVFLHPETKEEYALARKERKRGHGHTGFEVDCDPAVSLEEDLKRRDLTINAIAQDGNGRLIDPFGGQRDLKNRVLRHVSAAFIEDPLRVLRTARFAARYAHLGFTVAPETINLMRDIVRQGELAHLARERVWTELDKALGERNPETFFTVLRDCEALAKVLPELHALFDEPQPGSRYPDIDAGTHVLMALQQAAYLSNERDVRFAVLTHDLGRHITSQSEWPLAVDHAQYSLELLHRACQRLHPPRRYTELARTVCQHHRLANRARELTGATLLSLLTNTDALRRPERFELFLLACEATAHIHTGKKNSQYPQAEYLRRARGVIIAINAKQFDPLALSGKALGEAIKRVRIEALDSFRQPGK